MRFFIDTEFHDDGRTIDLISLAIVAENGDELYLVNADADWCRVTKHPWLLEYVLPHLPGGLKSCRNCGPDWTACWRPNALDPRVVSRDELSVRVRRFVASFGENRDEHELWAWYGAYDHVALAQLFGRMLNLPACVPMHTNDLKTIVGRTPVPESLRKRVGGEHDALADARWNQLVYRWAMQQEANLLYGWRQQVAARDSELVAHWQALTDAERESVRHVTRGRPFARLLDEAAGRPLP